MCGVDGEVVEDYIPLELNELLPSSVPL
jgi:hypothetical protein